MRQRAESSLNSNSSSKAPLTTSHPSESSPNCSRLFSRRYYLFAGVFTAAAGVFLARSNYQSTNSFFFQVPHWYRDPRKAFIRWSSFSGGTSEAHPAVRSSAPSAHTPFSKSVGGNQGKLISMYGGGSGVKVPARRDATGCVIFMHGLGDTGAGWSSAFPVPNLEHVEVVLPSADSIPISLNGGLSMPGWFDLLGLDQTATEDERGIEAAAARVNRIIDEAGERGIPSHRVVVAGFSQGGAVALTTALRSQRKLAGVVALSTWLPLRKSYPQMLGPYAKSTPLFVAHGTADQVVRLPWAELSVDVLQGLGIDAALSKYSGLAHSASQSELDDVAKFIARVIPPL